MRSRLALIELERLLISFLLDHFCFRGSQQARKMQTGLVHSYFVTIWRSRPPWQQETRNNNPPFFVHIDRLTPFVVGGVCAEGDTDSAGDVREKL